MGQTDDAIVRIDDAMFRFDDAMLSPASPSKTIALSRALDLTDSLTRSDYPLHPALMNGRYEAVPIL